MSPLVVSIALGQARVPIRAWNRTRGVPKNSPGTIARLCCCTRGVLQVPLGTIPCALGPPKDVGIVREGFLKDPPRTISRLRHCTRGGPAGPWVGELQTSSV